MCGRGFVNCQKRLGLRKIVWDNLLFNAGGGNGIQVLRVASNAWEVEALRALPVSRHRELSGSYLHHSKYFS